MPQWGLIGEYIGNYLLTPIWAACKAIFNHFTRYAAPTAGATRRAPGQRHICIDPTTETHTRREHHTRRDERRLLMLCDIVTFEGMKKAIFEGMKFYNKRQRAKLG